MFVSLPACSYFSNIKLLIETLTFKFTEFIIYVGSTDISFIKKIKSKEFYFLLKKILKSYVVHFDLFYLI